MFDLSRRIVPSDMMPEGEYFSCIQSFYIDLIVASITITFLLMISSMIACVGVVIMMYPLYILYRDVSSHHKYPAEVNSFLLFHFISNSYPTILYRSIPSVTLFLLNNILLHFILSHYMYDNCTKQCAEPAYFAKNVKYHGS